MGLLTSLKRYRFTSIVIIFLFLGLIYWTKSGGGSYSPEEINSLLQNKGGEVTDIIKKELFSHSFKAPYLKEGTFRIENWDVRGNTLVKNHQHIELTSDKPHQAGSIFSQEPLSAPSFEMELTFSIHSKSSANLMADGFAIWFIDKKSDIGDVFGAKNLFNGLGIFIDTYRNGKRGIFPFINIMLGDGHTEYTKEDDGFSTRLAGCVASKLVSSEEVNSKARIVYLKSGYFSLDFDYRSTGKWKNCVTLNDVHLPAVRYLGLSAETGELSQEVDIIENKIFSLSGPSGEAIGSIHELEELMESPDEKAFVTRKGRRSRESKGKQRKSLKRLKNSEKRIKERERQLRLEKYGNENAHFFNRLWWKIQVLIKYTLILLLGICLIWFFFLVVRVQRQRKRSKITGLLD